MVAEVDTDDVEGAVVAVALVELDLGADRTAAGPVVQTELRPRGALDLEVVGAGVDAVPVLGVGAVAPPLLDDLPVVRVALRDVEAETVRDVDRDVVLGDDLGRGRDQDRAEGGGGDRGQGGSAHAHEDSPGCVEAEDVPSERSPLVGVGRRQE
ncbi:hypothetical protein OG457_02770 [Streptomyces sp. NBC_01207]|nr:hypothetical protein OG457_02770 [Streptomyces sp. NBC_01207]